MGDRTACHARVSEPTGAHAKGHRRWLVQHGRRRVHRRGGFITIVGRAGRFAKIAGEMVPFAAVEQILGGLVGTSDDGVPRAVVTAVPDRLSGERLVVVHTALEQSPTELVRQLAASGLPRLYLPAPADFYQIATCRSLGSARSI